MARNGLLRTITDLRSMVVRICLACAKAGPELDNLPIDSEVRLATTQARTYDRNANQYPGFLASRRNYDVGRGIAGTGQWRSGVFEASWGSGGASIAELAALTALRFGKPRKPPARRSPLLRECSQRRTQ